MADRNLYQVLGVPRTASDTEIRKAYREIARKNHPDRNPGNSRPEERFKAASFAKEVLLNKKKRELYDEFGEAGLRDNFDADAFRAYNARQQRSGGASSPSGRRQPNLEDLFNSMRANPSGPTSSGWSGNFQ